MALHEVKLPKSSAHLFRVVVYLKRLLHALAEPNLNANIVNTAWVQGVWSSLDAEWVRKFCGQKRIGYIVNIAQAPIQARQSLYEEFCKQNKINTMLDAGGNFSKLINLPGFDSNIAEVVKNFFTECYKKLSHNANAQWQGYELHGKRIISNRIYKEAFFNEYPKAVVCPYCDGEIGTPDLDHYLSKSEFPLLACSPWNLIPICGSCNDVIDGKGENLPITLGTISCTNDWLHPIFRPASVQAQIRLTGTPRNSIPKLHSSDQLEQVRLTNHTNLVPSLVTRWTRIAAAHFDVLVSAVTRRLNSRISVEILIKTKLDDCVAEHGKAASSMVHAAVCRAILELRPEYIEEFTKPNTLAMT